MNYIENEYVWVQNFYSMNGIDYESKHYPRLALSSRQEYIAFTYFDDVQSDSSIGILNAQNGEFETIIICDESSDN